VNEPGFSRVIFKSRAPPIQTVWRQRTTERGVVYLGRPATLACSARTCWAICAGIDAAARARRVATTWVRTSVTSRALPTVSLSVCDGVCEQVRGA